MTQTTIGALVGGGDLALHEAGLPLLNMDLPRADALDASLGAEALADAGVTLERGQRFAVHQRVAYVPVRGVLTPNSGVLERFLGWSTYHGVAETMTALSGSDEVEAVVLFFDTPGGAVMGIQSAVAAIQACAAVKPVHALVHPLAASAGYWLASQCSDLSASPGSWVGSVGTMVTSYQPVQPGETGNQIYILTSEHAGAKRPDLSSEEGKAISMVRLNAMEAEFLEAVAQGRGLAVADVPKRMSRTDDAKMGGDVFWDGDAVARGLVDQIETVSAFMARIAELYAPKRQSPSRAYHAKAAAARAKAAL
jgi:ClpP class serine protease